MKLGVEVGLGPAGYIVLDGDPAPLESASTTKRLEETSRAPAYHLTEGD